MLDKLIGGISDVDTHEFSILEEFRRKLNFIKAVSHALDENPSAFTNSVRIDNFLRHNSYVAKGPAREAMGRMILYRDSSVKALLLFEVKYAREEAEERDERIQEVRETYSKLRKNIDESGIDSDGSIGTREILHDNLLEGEQSKIMGIESEVDSFISPEEVNEAFMQLREASMKTNFGYNPRASDDERRKALVDLRVIPLPRGLFSSKKKMKTIKTLDGIAKYDPNEEINEMASQIARVYRNNGRFYAGERGRY